jgi:hypothetical protein
MIGIHSRERRAKPLTPIENEHALHPGHDDGWHDNDPEPEERLLECCYADRVGNTSHAEYPILKISHAVAQLKVRQRDGQRDGNMEKNPAERVIPRSPQCDIVPLQNGLELE